MRNVLTIGLMFIVLGGHAQVVEVQDIEQTISKGKQPGLMINIPATNKGDIQKAWIKTLEENTKSKVDISGNEIKILDARVKDINDSLNIYSLLYEYPEKIQLATFFELPDGFIEEGNKYEYLAAKRFVRDFGEAVYYNVLQEKLDKEEDELKSLEKDYKKLLKQNEKIHKKIKEEERNIEKTENKIEINKLDQQRVRVQIQEQKDQLSKVENEALRKAEEKNLKNLQKQLSKLEKKNDKMYDDVDECEKELRELNRELADSAGELARKKKEVETQQEKVYNLQAKLKSLR